MYWSEFLFGIKPRRRRRPAARGTRAARAERPRTERAVRYEVKGKPLVSVHIGGRRRKPAGSQPSKRDLHIFGPTGRPPTVTEYIRRFNESNVGKVPEAERVALLRAALRKYFPDYKGAVMRGAEEAAEGAVIP